MVQRTRQVEDAVSATAFEAALEDSVRRKLAESRLVGGVFVLHPLKSSPLLVVQDLSAEETHVGYTAGAKTCTMLSVWGRTSDGSNAVLAVLHEGGMDEAYRRLAKVGGEFSSRGAAVEGVSYARGELAHKFGVLDEAKLRAVLGGALALEFSVGYFPSKENPIAYGFIAEARNGRVAAF
jgi:hypothetical protein